MYKACQSLTVSNPIRQEETNSMDMTKISISIINEGIMYTIYKVTTLRAQETTILLDLIFSAKWKCIYIFFV